MTYDPKKIFDKAKKIVKDDPTIFFIEDIIARLGIAKSTFYDFFPIDSNESDTLKELLESNRIDMKLSIRKKLHKGEKAAELLALYKLICTDQERQNLSMQYNKNEDVQPKKITVNVVKGTGKKKKK